MVFRKKLEEKVKKQEDKIDEMERLLRDEKIYLQALQDMIKIVPKDKSSENGKIILRAGSSIEKVYHFLQKKNSPAYILDILKGINKEDTRNNKVSLAGSLGAYVRKEQLFTKPAPNTFGLIEFNDNNEKEEKENEITEQ